MSSFHDLLILAGPFVLAILGLLAFVWASQPASDASTLPPVTVDECLYVCSGEVLSFARDRCECGKASVCQ